MKFGSKTSNYNGCGWIAGYNALKLLDEPVDAASLIHDFEDGVFAGGTLGTNPFFIGDYFKKKGYAVDYSFRDSEMPEKASKSNASILFFIRKDPLYHGAHFVAFAPTSTDLGEGKDVNETYYTFYNTMTNNQSKGADIRTLEEMLASENIIEKLLITISSK